MLHTDQAVDPLTLGVIAAHEKAELEMLRTKHAAMRSALVPLASHDLLLPTLGLREERVGFEARQVAFKIADQLLRILGGK